MSKVEQALPRAALSPSWGGDLWQDQVIGQYLGFRVFETLQLSGLLMLVCVQAAEPADCCLSCMHTCALLSAFDMHMPQDQAAFCRAYLFLLHLAFADSGDHCNSLKTLQILRPSAECETKNSWHQPHAAKSNDQSRGRLCRCHMPAASVN